MLKPFQAWITAAYREKAQGELEIQENLQYHLATGLSVCESIFRPGSLAHQRLIVEAREREHERGQREGDDDAVLNWAVGTGAVCLKR